MSGKKSRRVPVELKAVQDERLTCRHIQTLMKLQQATDENEQLINQIKILQNESSSCQELHKVARDSKRQIEQIKVDFINETDVKIKELNSCHEKKVSRMLEEKQRAKKLNAESLEKMQLLIENLEVEMEEKNNQIEKYIHTQNISKELEEKLKSNSMNLEKIENENKNLREELSGVKTLNSSLSADNVNALKTKSELESKIIAMKSKLDAEMESKRRLVEQNDLLKEIYQLRESLETLEKDNKDKDIIIDEFKEHIQRYEVQISSLEKSNSLLELERDALSQSSADLKQEVEYLKGKNSRSGDKSFSDYVTVKRELVSLKEENSRLKSSMPKADLKTLKSDGKKTGRIPSSRRLSKQDSGAKMI